MQSDPDISGDAESILQADAPRRRCRKCGRKDMILIAERWTGTSTDAKFTCSSCGHSQSFMLPGALGSFVLMWLIASTVITALFLYDKNGPTMFGIGVMIFFWFGVGGFFAWQLFKHFAYPLLPAPELKKELTNRTSDSDMLRFGIKWLERKSIWLAPLILLAGMAAIMAIATLVGVTIDGGF